MLYRRQMMEQFVGADWPFMISVTSHFSISTCHFYSLAVGIGEVNNSCSTHRAGSYTWEAGCTERMAIFAVYKVLQVFIFTTDITFHNESETGSSAGRIMSHRV